MGLTPCFNRCSVNIDAIAPNPSPSRWKLLEKVVLKYSYVLKVKYLDATNFEGVKIMVYTGKYRERHYLDPHFQDNETSPIARFKPTDEGWRLAMILARGLNYKGYYLKD